MAGAPFVSGAKVLGVIDGEARGPKIRVFKRSAGRAWRELKDTARFTRVSALPILKFKEAAQLYEARSW